MRAVYAERRDVLERLVRTYLADFLEPRVPKGGMQMPCILTQNIPEAVAVETAKRAGIDLLGLTALHASTKHKAGFLMGFAAHTPGEMEVGVKKLAHVLQALKH
jgi:GntR family transcriptional regulator/MocR family aminotransferase